MLFNCLQIGQTAVKSRFQLNWIYILFGLGLRNERGNTMVEWATSRKYKIVNTMFQKKAGRKRSDGITKTEIDYILTNRPDVTVINQVNIGSDHRLVISNIKLDVEVKTN